MQITLKTSTSGVQFMHNKFICTKEMK